MGLTIYTPWIAYLQTRYPTYPRMKGDFVAGCQLVADGFGPGTASLEQLAVCTEEDVGGMVRRSQP